MKGRWFQRFTLPGIALVLGGASACLSPCRSVEFRKIDLVCQTDSLFRGELHFDTAAPFRTFLTEDCGLGSNRSSEIIEEVDFSTEAVFVAVGDRFEPSTGCIASREVQDVAVCPDGLQVLFESELDDGETCSVRTWTVAFAMSRGEMAAAFAPTNADRPSSDPILEGAVPGAVQVE